MSKLGKRLIKAAQEGVAIARGELDPMRYRVHHASDDDDDAIRHVPKGDAFRFRSAVIGHSAATGRVGMKAKRKEATRVAVKSARRKKR